VRRFKLEQALVKGQGLRRLKSALWPSLRLFISIVAGFTRHGGLSYRAKRNGHYP